MKSHNYGRSLFGRPGKIRLTHGGVDLPQGHGVEVVLAMNAQAQGIGDMRVTPYGDLFPGVEVRASIIENLLEGDVLQRPDWMSIVDLAAIVLLGLALTWLLPRMGVSGGALLALGVLTVFLVLAN